MSDNKNLKALCEAAPTGPWLVENDSLYFKDDGYTRHLLDADAGHDVEDEAYYAALAFIAAANPAAVLALIAENERVKARLCVCSDCAGQGEVYSGHSTYQGQFQPPEPDMDMCGTCGGDGVLGPLEDFEALAAERDQLRAENAGLQTGYKAYEQVNAELRAEVEALKGQIGRLDKLDTLQIIAEQARQIETLRKELESRHPFKFAQEPTIGFTGCVICGVYTDHGGLPCPKIRATAVAHAAMGQGEQP